MDWIMELLTNPFLITSLSSWLIAQVLKTIIHAVLNKSLDITRLVGDGGMPSGHSATVTSLAAITGLIYGPTSFEFAMSAIFAIVVCHDAMGVRLETGKQAVILNEMIEIIEAMTREDLPEVKLKEFVGHSPIQVAAGVLLGIANACFMYFFVL